MATFNFLFQIIDELLTFNPILFFKDLFIMGVAYFIWSINYLLN